MNWVSISSLFLSYTPNIIYFLLIIVVVFTINFIVNFRGFFTFFNVYNISTFFAHKRLLFTMFCK